MLSFSQNLYKNSTLELKYISCLKAEIHPEYNLLCGIVLLQNTYSSYISDHVTQNPMVLNVHTGDITGPKLQRFLLVSKHKAYKKVAVSVQNNEAYSKLNLLQNSRMVAIVCPTVPQVISIVIEFVGKECVCVQTK